MENFYELVSRFAWFIPLFILCAIWDYVWKLIGMWKAGRNNDLAWFICIAIFNTMGLLPIIYILLEKKKSEEKLAKEEE
jgi:hypothetical protein